MKYNEKELARMSEGKSTIEGRLNHKKINTNGQYYQAVFKERWFKLIDNFLFYFRINDVGVIYEKQAAGVFVLENATIQPETGLETPFAFSIFFQDEPDKKHIFSCMSEKVVSTWITKLRCASYEYLRCQLFLLQSKIFSKTGKDPLLMVPRNLGSMIWTPNETCIDKSNALLKNNNFISHIHGEKFMTSVHRSKSTVNMANSSCTSNNAPFLENSWPGNPKVERSKTTVQMFNRLNPECAKLSFSDSHFGVSYHRSAPSPPPRKKNSPLLSRNNLKSETKQENFCVDNSYKNTIHPPLPPQRKNSPKNVHDSAKKTLNENNEISQNSSKNAPNYPKENSENSTNNISEVNLIEF